MFEKTKKKVDKALGYLKSIIKEEFYEENETFMKGYGKGVTEYFDEKKRKPLHHLMVQCKLFGIFYANKGEEFIDEMFDQSLDCDTEIGQRAGYLYFHLDEIMKH